MAESGWLTRSLEQPYPYDENYQGKIRLVKKEFLNIAHLIQFGSKEEIENVLVQLLKQADNIRQNNKIQIQPLLKKDSIVIDDICSSISTLINKNYHLSGGSKFPVLVFYSLYKIFLKEFKRYEECELVELGSHTASDLNSKSSGDIEVTKENIIYEAVELKLNVLIDLNIINRAIKKIHTYNPKRYFILSSKFNYHDRIEIDKKIKKLREQHGCQLIIDDPISYLKSCLRLIQDPENFLNTFSQLVVEDTELKIIHKENWKKILEKIS